MTMITPSYLGETIEYSSLHACRSTLEDPTYVDRADAGRQLGSALRGLDLGRRVVVLGIPRGGVVVGLAVAKALGAPLDCIVTRKLGAPMLPEYGIGAITEGGAVYVDRSAAREVGLSDEALDELAEREGKELARRVDVYRGGRPLPNLREATVVLVDDGIATGATVHAAIRGLREHGVKSLVLAVPVAATASIDELSGEVDDLVCLQPREDLFAIGTSYRDFGQTSDAEVVEYLEEGRRAATRAYSGLELADCVPLEGQIVLPPGASGLVLFAHGSGSSRLSPRNQFVAEQLRNAGCATLLFDLLTADEERADEETGELRFDVEFLARRLTLAAEWARTQPDVADLPFGYFGSSTGAAAALIAAADRPADVTAVVSRGGRPDLAGRALERVRTPTLLIVGGADRAVLELNREAASHLACEHELTVVPGARHLFEEPGTLERVAVLAAGWFGGHFSTGSIVRFAPATPPSWSTHPP